jgi:hypothetical protein
MFGINVGLPMQTSKCHQIPYHPFRNHGGLYVVLEWGHDSKNVGLQHKVLTHYGQLNVGRGTQYGRANMTCHL